MKLPSNLTLPNLIKEPVNQILEEVAPVDSAMYDVPMQETKILTILMKLWKKKIVL